MKEIEKIAAEVLAIMEELVRCYNESERDLCSKRRITVAESKIISSIDSGGQHYVNKIAASLNLSKSRISRLISSLKRKGLVAKKESEDDHRFNFISLTSKGVDVRNHFLEDKMKRCMETVSFIPEKERRDIVEHLEYLKTALYAYKDKRAGESEV